MAFDRAVTLHRPRAVMRALAAAPLLVSLVVLVLAALGRLFEGWLPLALDPLLFALIASVYVRRRNPRPEKVPARLAAGPDGVTVDGVKVLDRKALRRGYVQPWSGRPPTVRLVGRFLLPLLEVEVADDAEGAALLDALELGVAQQATRFSSLSPFYATAARRIWVPIGAALFGAGGSLLAVWLHLHGLAQVLPFFALLALPLAFPSSIHVGADGVLVTWLWRRRFYPFSEIVGVKVEGKGVRLWLHAGEAVDLPVVGRRGRALDRMRLDALVARIAAALGGAREGKRPVEVAALVARGGRTAEEWARAVRGILGGDGGDYRTSAVPEENLWRVAEDPTAEETARVGAAVALRMTLDDDGRARMLRVAEASVSPKVRVALRAAAGAEDAAILEALASYDALLSDSREEEKKRSERV
jgi:hypothetical protein